ncbi:conserved hypothetical protein [Chloroherpeton thalassium ATCC 35110]|uniref:Helicase HerA barrel domain-containing protein n=1 Tax=Chloroherpeton thalassium (strain ATCC 35110 / GB-78) TaxID=517418 RepID=B3QW91_CHLT3|nr:hypothetical protein [Chloroherpeton thalassium]ACF13204.1 conserved hypothetical protein [Chloroherpeton thalassium ATCC 35110]
MLGKTQHIGEVVSSNTVSFSAVIPDSSSAQAVLPVQFGDLIKVETESVFAYAVVYYIEHAPTDSHRKVFPHGRTKDELRREMPQVFELIQTSFHALMVGYEQNNFLRQGLPPQPPGLHDFVFHTTSEEQKAFFDKGFSYLRIFMNSKDVQPDELLVSFLRKYFSIIEKRKLVAIGKELSYLVDDDHRRLEQILERIFD